MTLPSGSLPWLLALTTTVDIVLAFRPFARPTLLPILRRDVPLKCAAPHLFPKDKRSSLNDSGDGGRRRAFLLSRALPTITSTVLILPCIANAATTPVQRAVGSAESQCRTEGNCLEKLDIDGAVGWNWGGVDRCDASDPLCGPAGRLRTDGLPKGGPVPPKDANYEITDVVELTLTVGTGSYASSGTLRMGLYGKLCPESVREMTDLCGKSGIVTSRDLLLGSPVRLGRGGGSMTYVRPDERVDFGIPSQRVAYARSIRKPKAPDEFVPQGRPGGERLRLVREEVSGRPHDVAGLVSIPKEGIGYGGGLVLGKDDEAYASAFQIMARGSLSVMDGEGRKVIGQLLDADSMDLLARLAGSPTRKLLPGQNGGTPLVKVTIDDSAVFPVMDLVTKENETKMQE